MTPPKERKVNLWGILSPLLAILAALATGGLLMLAIRADPFLAYKFLFLGAFGDVNGVAEVFVKATPLILAALGVAVAFRCGIWNIGAEGQLYLGAIGAAGVGIFLKSPPAYVMLPLVALSGFAAGAAYGAIPGLLKVRFGANEIIVTIMLNYVAIFLTSFLVNGPWLEPGGFVPKSADITQASRFPLLLPGTRLHAGALVAVAAAVCLYLFLHRTIWGYRLRAVGASPEAARFSGIRVNRQIVMSMVLGGAMAGLAGAGEVAGVHYHLVDDLSPGYGYTAIVVALLGKLHPLGLIIAAFFFAALQVGSESMQRSTGMHMATIFIIEGLIVLFLLGTQMLLPSKARS
ncbi:MAG: ABC transporter permease [Nitrospinota bacterium]